MSPVILAFLQNPWFRAGTDQLTIDRYTVDPDFHRRVLALSMTGKRLVRAFRDLYGTIWWDNASPVPVFTPSGAMPPDLEHIQSRIVAARPSLILTFGNNARDGVMRVNARLASKIGPEATIPLMVCHHPNARGKNMQDLHDFAQKVREWNL